MAEDNGFFNINNFTPRAKRVLYLAQQEAERLNHDYIGTEHILLGLLSINEGVAIEILKFMNLNLENLRREVEKAVPAGGEIQTEGPLPITEQANKLLANAEKEARAMNYNFVGTEHILLAMLKMHDTVAYRIFRNLKVDIDVVREKLFSMLDSNFLPDMYENNDGITSSAGGKSDDELNALNSYGRNLTALAAEGKLDPVIGRQDEIARVIQILCRRTKNNPVLIGEAGVGKTAIIEGLAQRIVNNDVPELLTGKMVYALDLPLMVAGTKYRGDFEERVKKCLAEVKKAQDMGYVVCLMCAEKDPINCHRTILIARNLDKKGFELIFKFELYLYELLKEKIVYFKVDTYSNLSILLGIKTANVSSNVIFIRKEYYEIFIYFINMDSHS